MTTFALIDIHSGYFWGYAVADDVETACRIVDENIGENYANYGKTDRRDAAAHYDVYDVAAIEPRLVDADGQDESIIAIIEDQPFVARVVRS